MKPPAALPVLTGARVTLRPATTADARRFAAIVAEPSVAEWWMSYDATRFRRDLSRSETGRGERFYAVEVEGEVAGLMDFGEETDPDYESAYADIALGTAWQGRGLGSEALRLLLRYLFEERSHHRATIDPAVANERAVRTYEAVGFRPVGVMRGYERGPDGAWRDSLLMDLLAEEFLGG